MTATALWILLLVRAAIQVAVAPDQPLPFVYTDDPLIVELKSSADTEARVTLEVQAEHHASPTTVSLGAATLHAGGAYWWAVDGIPTDRGRYRVKLVVAADGQTMETVTSFCRVGRPSPEASLPLCVRLKDIDNRALLALKSVGVQCVRLDAEGDDLAQRINDIRNMGANCALRLDVADAANVESRVDELLKKAGNAVARWELAPVEDTAVLASIAQAFRRGGSRVPVALVTTGPEHLKRMLDGGAGQFLDVVVLEHDAPKPEDIIALRTTAEQAGYERVALYVSGRGIETGASEEHARFVRQILSNCACGIVQTEVARALLLDGEFSGSYAHLSAMSNWLGKSVYVGPLPVPAPGQAPAFRCGDRWVAALWTGGEPQTVEASLGEAADLALTDVRDNPMPPPAVQDGRITLELRTEPVILTGRGGTVMAEAAWNAARAEAQVFCGLAKGQPTVPAEAVETAQAIAGKDVPEANRLGFFTLLRTFPAVEERWHARDLPRAVAVPVMASAARLARHLCVVEQERGEPFVEPLKDTLERSREYESLYLTGSITASDKHARADWLLQEVNRLMAEAELLKETGRPVEAGAVAAIAEWRARSLEHAAKAAPLHEPDPYKPVATEESVKPPARS